MLKKSASGVLASFRPSTYPKGYASALHSLWPCLGKGASQGEEAISSDSGREGEISAGVGWVRSQAILSTLLTYRRLREETFIP